VRLTVVDKDVHAVELTAQDDGRQRCDIRRHNMERVKYRTLSLPGDVDSMIRRLMTSYGLRYAAIDMVVAQDGRWYFLEINPNGTMGMARLGRGDEHFEFIRQELSPGVDHGVVPAWT
jgi:hypothetical protein